MASKTEVLEKDLSGLQSVEDPKQDKKKSLRKFLVYFLIIIVLTGLALFLSLYNEYESVLQALKHSDWRYLLVILGLVAFT